MTTPQLLGEVIISASSEGCDDPKTEDFNNLLDRYSAGILTNLGTWLYAFQIKTKTHITHMSNNFLKTTRAHLPSNSTEFGDFFHIFSFVM